MSSICAGLAETDVINAVSHGIETRDTLRGIHQSMAGRFAGARVEPSVYDLAALFT